MSGVHGYKSGVHDGVHSYRSGVLARISKIPGQRSESLHLQSEFRVNGWCSVTSSVSPPEQHIGGSGKENLPFNRKNKTKNQAQFQLGLGGQEGQKDWYGMYTDCICYVFEREIREEESRRSEGRSHRGRGVIGEYLTESAVSTEEEEQQKLQRMNRKEEDDDKLQMMKIIDPHRCMLGNS